MRRGKQRKKEGQIVLWKGKTGGKTRTNSSWEGGTGRQKHGQIVHKKGLNRRKRRTNNSWQGGAKCSWEGGNKGGGWTKERQAMGGGKQGRKNRGDKTRKKDHGKGRNRAEKVKYNYKCSIEQRNIETKWLKVGAKIYWMKLRRL